MEELIIDKDIPIPDKRSRATKYPLNKLNIGDSFFIPGKNNQNISGSFMLYRPKKFSVRKWEQDGIQGLRIWRIL